LHTEQLICVAPSFDRIRVVNNPALC